jgi:impB/mucB/samB family
VVSTTTRSRSRVAGAPVFATDELSWGEARWRHPKLELPATAMSQAERPLRSGFRLFAELRGKPVAVGGSREPGVVPAASYQALQFGVHSAMPSITAKRKCPDLIFVKPRFDAYKAIPLQIREIFAEYTPIIEPLSLDEAYLDVTENLKGISSATQIAEEIRARIRAGTELTASAGGRAVCDHARAPSMSAACCAKSFSRKANHRH